MKNTNEVYSEVTLQNCLKFWELHDFVFNDNKTKIFHCLYLDLTLKDYTSVKLCVILHISESTLLRYKKLFERSVEYFCANKYTREVV